MKPEHLVIIPDGNRRWAKKRNLPPWKGHETGAETLRRIAKNVIVDNDIKYFTFWAMSKDNFEKRSKQEINMLIKLISKGIQAFYKERFIKEKEVAINFYGAWKEFFSKTTVQKLEKIQKETKKYTKHYISILLIYDGQEELSRAINLLCKDCNKKQNNNIDINTIKNYLWTRTLPNVDFIIRTGIENDPHLSGHMLMLQTGYSQLYFTKTFWPDFDNNELKIALNNYEQREKRQGK